MTTRPLRRAILRIALVGIFATTSAPALAGQDTTLIDAVVRLAILNGPEAIVAALSYNSTILLPVARFLAMSEIRMANVAPGDSLTAIIEPGSIPVTFVPRDGRLVVGDSTFTIPAADARWRGADLFVATATLDRAFNVHTVMDWPTLTTNVRGTAGLPVIRRLRRERRHGLLRPRRPPPPVPTLMHPNPRLADGLVVEWSARGATNSPFEDFSTDIGVGAQLLGGSFELRQRTNRLFGSTDGTTRMSWERAWFDKQWIKQLRMGDVLSNGRRSRLVQGVAVTNAPFIRSSEFDLDAVIGQLPAGWEVELYERGNLRGFHEAEAVDVFRLPLELRYGSNPFDLVFYGPSGEVIREERTIRVPHSRLTKGQFEYAVAGGRCRFETCRGLMSSDVRYGLNNRVTLQSGVDAFWTDRGNLWQPYGIVSAAPLTAVHTTGEIVLQEHVRGTVEYEPSLNLRVTASHTLFDDDGARVTARSSTRNRTDASVHWRPDGNRSSLAFSFSGFVATGPDTHQNNQRVSARWRDGWLQYDAALRREVFRSGSTNLVNRNAVEFGTWANLAQLTPRLAQTTARANVGVDLREGIDRFQTSFGRQIGRALRVDIGVSWFRVGGATLDLRLNTLLRGPRLGSASSFSGQGGNRSTTTFDGSMVIDPRTRQVQFSDGRDLGRAGLAGVVYLDDNGNGERDPGEPGLEGVAVQVGGWPEFTDAEGRFAAWNVAPFELSVIEIDTLGLGDPRYTAPNPFVAINATPNSFISIDLPIVIGAEVGGFVVHNGQPLPGAMVEIQNLRTGATIKLTTFADGGFYKIGLAPGDYQVRVMEEVLTTMEGTSFPFDIHIPTGRAADEVQWDDIILRITTPPGQ